VAASNGAAYNLRALRRDRGLSQDAVAVLSGLTGAEISLLERGKVSPRPETVVKLARALGIGASRLQRILQASAAGRDGEAA
jgi:transcriptional regulator with XRE-family HTH domain